MYNASCPCSKTTLSFQISACYLLVTFVIHIITFKTTNGKCRVSCRNLPVTAPITSRLLWPPIPVPRGKSGQIPNAELFVHFVLIPKLLATIILPIR